MRLRESKRRSLSDDDDAGSTGCLLLSFPDIKRSLSPAATASEYDCDSDLFIHIFPLQQPSSREFDSRTSVTRRKVPYKS